jgi:hypothetical protein
MLIANGNCRPEVNIQIHGSELKEKAMPTALFVSTRKGAWIFRADSMRTAWEVNGPHFLGHIISHLVLDPRNKTTLLAAA